MLNQLSEDQLRKMQEVKDFWLNYIFSCRNSIDREKAKISINLLYKSVGRKSPIVIYVDSPMACQYAVAYLKELIKLIPQTIPPDQVRAHVRDQVRAQVSDQVSAQVSDHVWDQVRAQVRAQVWDQGLKYESFCAYGSISDYGWVSFYDFFTQIGIINHKGFNEFKELIMSGIYDMIQLSGFCIVADLPIKIIRNSAGRLHNPNGPAIEFKDGYKQYYINGRALPSWIWERCNELTAEDFLSQNNDEIRAGIYEVLGEKRMIELLGANEVDSVNIQHGNKESEIISLLKTKSRLNKVMDKPYAWIKRICPSTGTVYLTPTNPDFETAIESAKFHRPDFVPASIPYIWQSRS